MKTAYPQIKGNCSIRLYSNIPFDNTYQHHSLISREFVDDGDVIYGASDVIYGLPKERFINRKTLNNTDYYYPRYDLTGEFNFNFSNGLIASVVLELTPEQTNANYMRLACGEDIYYYFITGISQNNYDTYTLSLELDVLMTYQDEFLEGMSKHNTPVETARKHCHRFNWKNYPYCPDFKNSESAYAGVKPSITKYKAPLKLKGGMELLSDVSWLYIAYEPTGDNGGEINRPYRYKECAHPITMLCQPYNKRVVLGSGSPTNLNTLTTNISKVIGDGKVHGCKILPYPPFYDEDAVVSIDSNGLYHISSPHLTYKDYQEGVEPNPHWEYILDSGKTKIVMYPDGTGHDHFDLNDVNKNTFVLQFIGNSKYKYKDVALPNITDIGDITINRPRITDPRLLFEPFTKYVLASAYSSDYVFYPELIYGEHFYASNVVNFETSTTAYIGDTSIITYLSNTTHYNYYKDLNIGLSSNVNYNIPAGTNALDVFNSTQAQSYYQSKIATGITSGLTIAGGVGSTIGGIVLTATGGGAPAGVGLIAGGLTATASGIASSVNNAKSVNAKIEDLKNTPDSYNVQGGNYLSDYVRTEENMPYVIIYECSTIVKDSANDFFYNYGYAVARDCYFNLDMYYDTDDHLIDNRLFTRTIFNYIQLNEDITNKIDYNMPLIIKQKISNIFTKGITLWSFFNNGCLWGTSPVSASNDPDKWFMRHQYENAEYDY